MNASNAALLRAYPMLWTHHDVDAVVALFTDDCVYEDAVLGWVHRGKGELREFAAGCSPCNLISGSATWMRSLPTRAVRRNGLSPPPFAESSRKKGDRAIKN